MTKRNQTCPCGSGLKYKKCCGGAPTKIGQHISSSEKGFLLKLLNSKRMLEAELACRDLIQTHPRSSYLFNFLGITLKEQNKLSEAEQAFGTAIQIKPDYAAALCNRGIALRYLGQLDAALRNMQDAVASDPDDIHIFDSLINLLNYHMPDADTDYPYLKAQKSLRQVQAQYSSTDMIADETVRRLYQQCHGILSRHDMLALDTTKTQLYRGGWPPNDCARHKMVFDAFDIIPEYCFECYKVTIEPRTVLELFKLLLVFDKLDLPKDNDRKCIIETRPGISGSYKGFIYCRGLDEGMEILEIVREVLGQAISGEVPVLVKRGCSEFPLAYPAFGLVTKDKNLQMSYNEEWRKHEEYADKNMATQKFNNPNGFTHNHSDFTLLDILVMRKWIDYAKQRGDSSFLKIAVGTLGTSDYKFLL